MDDELELESEGEEKKFKIYYLLKFIVMYYGNYIYYNFLIRLSKIKI